MLLFPKYGMVALRNHASIVALALLTMQIAACKKLVEIGPPPTSITTPSVFADSADATSAILGIYSTMINNAPNLACAFESIYSGMSADELLPFFSQGDQISTNTLTSSNGTIASSWTTGYSLMYQVNSCLEGLQASSGLSAAAKNQLIGEARFLRALYYFYLVNLYGDVPLLTSSDYKTNALAARTSKDIVYDTIFADLKAAKELLPMDYASFPDGERSRANSYAATALLARAYLYRGQWADAEKASSEILGNTALFGLNLDLNQVFSPNNIEAILQWRLNTQYSPGNATFEGIVFVPFSQTQHPRYYLTSQLYNAFETNDARKSSWLDSTNYAGRVYYYPYKYKIGPAEQAYDVPATEYYTVFRVAEQLLIRAEARTQLNDLDGAKADLDAIRGRANLDSLPASMSQVEMLAAVAQERRVELFAEWGHRWLDLKRTGQVDAVLKGIKLQWQSYQQLYPIPLDDLRQDPNLKQNPGYNN